MYNNFDELLKDCNGGHELICDDDDPGGTFEEFLDYFPDLRRCYNFDFKKFWDDDVNFRRYSSNYSPENVSG